MNADGRVTNEHETLTQMGFGVGALVVRAKDKTVAKIKSVGDRVILELQDDANRGKEVTCSPGSFLKKEWKLHKVKRSAGAVPDWHTFSPHASPDFAVALLKGHVMLLISFSHIGSMFCLCL